MAEKFLPVFAGVPEIPGSTVVDRRPVCRCCWKIRPVMCAIEVVVDSFPQRVKICESCLRNALQTIIGFTNRSEPRPYSQAEDMPLKDRILRLGPGEGMEVDGKVNCFRVAQEASSVGVTLVRRGRKLYRVID